MRARTLPEVSCKSEGLTVRTALTEGTRRLAEAGCPEARLDAEVLLAHVLGSSRAYLYAHTERCLSGDEAVAWEEALARRACREPTAYIVGYKEFYGMPLAVDRRVLVPRPETEMIVERTLALAAERPLTTVWDVGTGSGALALALAQHLRGTHLVASDISAGALEVAATNRRRLGLEAQVQLVRCDLLTAAREPLDAVVANLPYLTTDEWRQAMPEVAQYEPRLALDGGRAGLELVERLLAQAAALQPAPRLLLLEIGAGQGAAALDLADRYFPGHWTILWRDYAGWDRVLEIGEFGEAQGRGEAPCGERLPSGGDTPPSASPARPRLVSIAQGGRRAWGEAGR